MQVSQQAWSARRVRFDLAGLQDWRGVQILGVHQFGDALERRDQHPALPFLQLAEFSKKTRLQEFRSGRGGLQAGAISAGLPFALILLVCCVSLWKGLSEDSRALKTVERGEAEEG